MSEADCEFCPPKVDDLVVVENGTCVGLWDRKQPPLVLPRAHRRTAFDLTAEEVRDTFDLLRQLKAMVEDVDPPDGWNIGWNIEAAGGQVTFHAHCHLLPGTATSATPGEASDGCTSSPRTPATPGKVPSSC